MVYDLESLLLQNESQVGLSEKASIRTEISVLLFRSMVVRRGR